MHCGKTLIPPLASSVVGIPTGGTFIPRDISVGIHKTRGYSYHCDSGPKPAKVGLHRRLTRNSQTRKIADLKCLKSLSFCFLFSSSRYRVCVSSSQAQGATIKPKCHRFPRFHDFDTIVTTSYLCT